MLSFLNFLPNQTKRNRKRIFVRKRDPYPNQLLAKNFKSQQTIQQIELATHTLNGVCMLEYRSIVNF